MQKKRARTRTKVQGTKEREPTGTKSRKRKRESADGKKGAAVQKRETEVQLIPTQQSESAGTWNHQSFSSSPKPQTPPEGFVDMINLNITQLCPDHIRSGCLECGSRVADDGPAAAAPRNASRRSRAAAARRASVAHVLNHSA